jgi:hypothetical protein
MPHLIDPTAITVLTDVAATVEFSSWPTNRSAGESLAHIVKKFATKATAHPIAADRLYDTVTAILACEIGNPYTWGADKTPAQVADAITCAVMSVQTMAASR